MRGHRGLPGNLGQDQGDPEPCLACVIVACCCFSALLILLGLLIAQLYGLGL